jgi:hypothetical protein
VAVVALAAAAYPTHQMFSKLPQSFTAPFELGDGAKLAFRSQPGGISKLATTRVCKVKIFRNLNLTKSIEHT